MKSSSDDLAEIRAERDWLRDFFDNAPDPFVSVEAHTGKILDCNNTTLGILGRSRDDVIGSQIATCYHPDCLPEVQRAFEEFSMTGEARSEQLFLLKADGGKLPVSLRVSAVRDDNGDVLYSRSIWRDKTLEHENETLRIEARLQKAQRFESLAVLAGGIAHDFNNLLVGILGNAGLALMSLTKESPAREVPKRTRRFDVLVDRGRPVWRSGAEFS